MTWLHCEKCERTLELGELACPECGHDHSGFYGPEEKVFFRLLEFLDNYPEYAKKLADVLLASTKVINEK